MNYVNLLDIVYPVNSIYMSLSDESPSEFIGGIWYKLEPQKYLMSAGNDIDIPGSIGGTNSVTLTLAQMPQHRHAWAIGTSLKYIGSGSDGAGFSLSPGPDTRFTNLQGESASHTNMPAYYAVNIWIRIA